MAVDSAPPSKYDPQLVERAAFEEVLRRHPARLTVGELLLRIVGDPEDDLEVEVAAEAIHSLRASGLIRYRKDDRIVEATDAALGAVTLLAEMA